MPTSGIASPPKIGCPQFLHQRSLKPSVNKDPVGSSYPKNLNIDVMTGALYWCPVLPGCSVLTHGGWMAPQQPAVMGAQHSTAPPRHSQQQVFSVSQVGDVPRPASGTHTSTLSYSWLHTAFTSSHVQGTTINILLSQT